ncbi:MAG TPA: RNA 2',3'-cyclic phosphodiesterase [Candidatus Ratteibacteria bacterium]|nr:RNA 2',3'-cyclic phosphodiesterase [Candidatus Ratteibacteria bacterium]
MRGKFIRYFIKMRLFVGIKLPDNLKEEIRKIEASLRKKVREVKVVSPENLHITLKFLGEVGEKDVGNIDEKLNEVKKKFSSFDVSIGKIGSFPDDKKIRVLWIGVESHGKLKKLNSEIEKQLVTIGYKEENRFTEHITIARFKSTPDLGFIEKLKEKYNMVISSFKVENFSLINSKLTKSGPIYEDLETYKLGG